MAFFLLDNNYYVSFPRQQRLPFFFSTEVLATGLLFSSIAECLLLQFAPSLASSASLSRPAFSRVKPQYAAHFCQLHQPPLCRPRQPPVETCKSNTMVHHAAWPGLVGHRATRLTLDLGTEVSYAPIKITVGLSEAEAGSLKDIHGRCDSTSVKSVNVV